MMKQILVLLLLLGLAAPGQAQTGGYGSPLVTQRFLLNGPGYSPPLTLSAGQSVCSVVILNTTPFSGLTMLAEVASDGPYIPSQWVHVPAIDGGAIQAVGTYVGNITSLGITNFRVHITGLGGGSVTGVTSCTATSGAGQHVNIDNAPVSTFAPTPTNVGSNVGQSVIGYNYGWNGTQWDGLQMDATDGVLVADGGTSTRSAASAATTVIKSSPGRLTGLVVTTTGTGVFTCYDNATTGSGTVIAGFAASAPVFSTFTLRPWAKFGITCVSAASGPVVTALYI